MFKIQSLRNASNAVPRWRSGFGHTSKRAFTLVEILIVVGIVGIVAGVGIPAMVNSLHKEGMRKAVNDLIEGCGAARRVAIFSGQPGDLVIRPADGTINVRARG